MSERARRLGVTAVMVAMAAAIVFLVASEPSDVDRAQALGSKIRCPVCQGESIADSPAGMAQDMMDLVEQRVAEGASDQQVIDELLGSYSGAVLLDPPASGSTLLLWLAPLGAVLVGVATVVWWKGHPAEPVPDSATAPAPRSRKRMVIGGILLVGSLAIVVGAAGLFLQDRGGPMEGVADLDERDLSEVSNETMEAVIAANLDDPQIDGMRLALAERYYSEGDYQAAFPHYLAVAQSDQASDTEAAAALTRLGWMAFEGNGEVDTADRLLDQALALEPGSPIALYLKGRVRWCGAGDSQEAVGLFEQVLASPDLPADTRAEVESDLELASTGAACT